jgi:hypothetical protein|tara:strand:- start:33237 stop:33425 length:189 start_codon:yes stop_codon:yes gene_type:complete
MLWPQIEIVLSTGQVIYMKAAMTAITIVGIIVIVAIIRNVTQRLAKKDIRTGSSIVNIGAQI